MDDVEVFEFFLDEFKFEGIGVEWGEGVDLIG